MTEAKLRHAAVTSIPLAVHPAMSSASVKTRWSSAVSSSVSLVAAAPARSAFQRRRARWACRRRLPLGADAGRTCPSGGCSRSRRRPPARSAPPTSPRDRRSRRTGFRASDPTRASPRGTLRRVRPEPARLRARRSAARSAVPRSTRTAPSAVKRRSAKELANSSSLARKRIERLVMNAENGTSRIERCDEQRQCTRPTRHVLSPDDRTRNTTLQRLSTTARAKR